MNSRKMIFGKRLWIFLLILVTITSCKTKEKTTGHDPEALPAFLTEKISEYKKQNDPKHQPVITRYTFNNVYVYYFKMPCCDQQNVLYDEQGKELCRPDGGLTGNGDGKCPGFNSEKKDPRQIWPEQKQD